MLLPNDRTHEGFDGDHRRSLVFAPLFLLVWGCSGQIHENGEAARRIAFQDNTYDTYLVDLNETELLFFLSDKAGSRFENFAKLKQQLGTTGKELVFATNGGMFQSSLEPNGLYIENGELMFPLDLTSGEGNFYLKPNGVFQLSSKSAAIVPSSKWKAVDDIQFATQSGPLLVANGKPHPRLAVASQSKYIRSGVGLISQNRVIFAISNEPVNFYDFAMFFKDCLKCRDALYLDGQISKMYLPDLNRHELDGRFGPLIAVAR